MNAYYITGLYLLITHLVLAKIWTRKSNL